MKFPTMVAACFCISPVTCVLGIQRERGVGVPQDTREGFSVHPAGQCMGGEGMTQSVEGDTLRDPGLTQQGFQPPVARVGGDGLLQLERTRKYSLAGECFLSCLEHIRCALGEQDLAPSPAGFRLARFKAATNLSVQSSTDLERPRPAVEILPLEPTNFTPAQAGGEFGVEEVVPERVGLDNFHEAVQLPVCEDALGWTVCFRQRQALDRILGNDMGSNRVCHSPVEHGVDASDGAGGESAAMFRVFPHAPLLFQFCVHSLDVRRGN